MQATLNSTAFAPRMQFARRGTMVRSEKRRRPDPQRSYDGGGYDRRPPRRRKPRAGFFYKLLMVILLLTLWPIGLILLWRRKLDWSILAKLFTSVITLMACILLIGFALTVETGNPTYTAVQDSVNGFLDSAADSLIDFSVSMGERANLSLEAVNDIRSVYEKQSLTQTADAIDWGVALATNVREKVGSFLESISGSPEATPVPDEEGEEPAETPEDEIPDLSGDEASDVETPEPLDGEEDLGEEDLGEEDFDEESYDVDSDAPVKAPGVEITVNTTDETLPVYIPGEDVEVDLGTPIVGGMLSRSGALEPGELPTPTPEPTPEILRFAVKPAGEATVYFNIGSGQYYHMAPVCGSMKSADTHSFADVAENIHEPCSRCNPPAKELLDEKYIIWMDEKGGAHISDECPAFQGQWSIIPAKDAIDAGNMGCPICGADHYLAALADGKTVELNAEDAETEATEPAKTAAEPTPEPTPEATLAPTPEPSPQVVTPRETLKPASRAIVYHSSNGRFYHTNDHCSGMTGGSPYSLSQCVDDGYKQCHTCNAPSPEALEHNCLWVDEDQVCHVSDECEYFAGQYTLLDRDEALEQGLTACAHCGAADYLIPFSVMSTYQRLDEDTDL